MSLNLNTDLSEMTLWSLFQLAFSYDIVSQMCGRSLQKPASRKMASYTGNGPLPSHYWHLQVSPQNTQGAGRCRTLLQPQLREAHRERPGWGSKRTVASQGGCVSRSRLRKKKMTTLFLHVVELRTVLLSTSLASTTSNSKGIHSKVGEWHKVSMRCA